jgi:hypothetical protein
VLFASPRRIAQSLRLPQVDVGWVREGAIAIVVDLEGVASVAAGVALAAKGFRPVPLYNGAHGADAVVDQEPLLAALAGGADALRALDLRSSAPPAFLLDARRFPARTAAPGKLDNRWMVFPQDLPSANLLLSRGIRRAVVLFEGRMMDDLAHVLRRWQEGGVRIEGKPEKEGDLPRAIDVPKPSRYRAMWYRALAILGLGRSDAGGFGMRVPVPAPPSSGGGGGFRGGGFFH